MKYASAILAFIFTMTPVNCFSFESIRSAASHYRTKGDFYSTATGTVAYLPRVGSEEYLKGAATHWVVPKSGCYVLPQKSNHFFRINHKMAPQGQVSYLGVVVCNIYASPVTHRNELDLSRNDSPYWYSGYKERKLSSSKSNSSPDVKIHNYIDAHSNNSSDVFYADKVLKFNWHAFVTDNNESDFTYGYKSKWSANINDSCMCENGKTSAFDANSTYKTVTARMIRFETTSKRAGFSSVDFGFNRDNAIGTILYIFSPLDTEKFDRIYCFIYDKSVRP